MRKNENKAGNQTEDITKMSVKDKVITLDRTAPARVYSTVRVNKPEYEENKIKYYAKTKELCSLLAQTLDKYLGSFAVQSFDPRVLRYFKKYRPRFARGQLVSKAPKRSERKGTKANNPIVAFALNHLLLNVLSRPDFISIQNNHTKELGFVLATEIFKAKAFIWTVRSNKQYIFFKRQGYCSIFEHIKPD